MRFDEASAIYAEFGRFFVGMVCPVDELVDRVGLT
jgi:chlorite dismutase